MLWALKQAPVENPGEHVVLIAMADYTGDDGRWCFASKETIAKDALMSERSVRRHWVELERRGLIESSDSCDHEAFLAIPERYRPNAWRLRVDRHRSKCDVYCDGGDNVSPLPRGDNSGQSRGDSSDQARGDKVGLRGAKRGRSGVTQVSPKPSTRTRTRTTRSSTSRSNRSDTNRGEYGTPARSIGGSSSPSSGTTVQRRGTPRPDSSAGLANRFRELAESTGIELDSHDLSDAALAANIRKWRASGVSVEDIRSDMDVFFRSRDARRGDTPLWRRFLSAAYRMRQSRRPEPAEDYDAGLEFTEKTRFDS